MLVRVKICGINDAAGFDAAVAAGADWIGFNFFPPSPRFVTPAQAAVLSARYPGGPARVGLFVDPTEAQITETLATLHLHSLQLYGASNPALRPRPADIDIWRAVGVATAADLPAETDADALVIEARAPSGASRPGGNASRFDWTILTGWTPPAPWLLAGGLTPGNVADAIRITGAPAVDVSSGVESAPGRKDPALIASFVKQARNFTQA